MPEFEIDQQTEEEIDQFIDEWFSAAPEIMGISEAIAGCEVTNVDTYGVGVGVFPRYVTARVYEYTVPVLYRGFPTIQVNDRVTVLHFREANRYEVIGISGNTGSSPTVTGSGANTQVAYWTGTYTLAGDAGLTYNAATDSLTIAGQLDVEGYAAFGNGSPVDAGITVRIDRDFTDSDATPARQLQVAGGIITKDTLVADIRHIDVNPGGSIVDAVALSTVASVYIDEPNITLANGGTVTTAVTVYIQRAPTEGSTNNFALFVDDGVVRLDDGITFGGANTENILTVPDTAGQALNLVDAGGTEYLRIDSNPQLTVIWNELGADIDHRWEAVGQANAVFIRGSDGRMGIGTNNPGAPLEVNHATLNVVAVFESGDNRGAIQIRDDDTIGYFTSENGGIGFGGNQGLNVNNFNISITTGNAALGSTGLADAKLKVDQRSTTGAIPVLYLDQADEDVVLMKVVGTAAAASADRTLVADADFGTPGALVGWIQIEIEDIGNRVADADYWVPFYATPT